MPIYGYHCQECSAEFELDAPLDQAGARQPCPVCSAKSDRLIAAPRLMFKSDPRENRPYWHNHVGYSHSHPPRRGRHARPEDDH